MKLTIKAAMLAACILAPAAAAAQGDLIQNLFDKAEEMYAAEGYKATGWTHRGRMKQGDAQMFAVTLQGGSSYHLVGV